MSRKILLDADLICHAHCSAKETPVHWGNDLWTLHSDAKEIRFSIETHIDWMKEHLEAQAVILAWNDLEGGNFRKDILPSYKGNRSETRKPTTFYSIREWMMDVYSSYSRPNLEGDDILGILATHRNLEPAEEKIIVTIDKDLQTIPGLHFNYSKQEQGIFHIDRQAADFWHMVQTLAGDQTDGYSGCPGIGEKTAKEALEDPHELVQVEREITRGKNAGTTRTEWKVGEPCDPWTAVVSRYRKAGLGEREALAQAQVARICRAEDYDFKNRRVIPWTP